MRVSGVQTLITDTIIESLPVGALAIDRQGEIILANDAASRILGYPIDMLLGNGWGSLFLEQPANAAFNQVLLDVIWHESCRLQRTVPYTRPDGEELYLAITSSFLRDGQGVVGIVIILDDITAIHSLHLKEKAWLEEKNRLHQEKAEGLRRLAMAVAHQVRNPTAAIGGMAHLIQKKLGQAPAVQTYCREIGQAVARLETIVRAVERYVALPAAQPRWCEAPAFFQSLQQEAQQWAAAQGCPVRYRFQCQPAAMYADPHLLRLALQEIIRNALENMTEPGTIVVEAANHAAQLSIRVTDTGRGIDPADLPFIFDPFFTTKVAGVGMGLCLAAKIVQDQAGSITVHSQPRAGTSVAIQLPQPPQDKS
jgi:PAS domain S-box-containing protein